MPTYELSCRACGNRFELFRTRLLRDEEQVCPDCGSADVRRGVGGGVLLGRGGEDKGTAGPPTCGTGYR